MMTLDPHGEVEVVRSGALDAGRRSARHLKHRLDHPREDDARHALRRAARCLLLTPDRFPLDFAVWRGDRRRGNAWDEFCAANAGRTIIKAEEYGACVAMRDSLRAHPVAGPLLEASGESGKVIRWIDRETGLPCEARLDRLTGAALLVLETAPDLDARRFGVLAHRAGLHVKVAFAMMGLRALGVERAPKLVVVEPSPPYDVAVFAVGDDALCAGEEEVREVLTKISTSSFSGRWPGRYERREERLELPTYAFPGRAPGVATHGEGASPACDREEAA